MLVGYFVIYLIPGYTVMNISGSYFYSQYESSAVAGCVSFISKLPLMLSLYKHTTVRIGGGYCLFCSSYAGRWLGIIVILVFFNGLLT